MALSCGFEYRGWCPAGGWAEDFPTPPGLLARYPHLQPTPSADPAERTEWNVRDSDATILILDDQRPSPGTSLTEDCCLRYRRPYCSTPPRTPEALRQWLVRTAVPAVARARGVAPSQLDALALNIAGPRESEHPGIFERTRDFLTAVLRP